VRRPQLNPSGSAESSIHPNARSPQTGSRSRQGGTFAPTRRRGTPWVSSSKEKLLADVRTTLSNDGIARAAREFRIEQLRVSEVLAGGDQLSLGELMTSARDAC
jgi:hypothetical protein